MKADLTLEGSNKVIKVLEFDFDFSQQTDSIGIPNGVPFGGRINFVIESTTDTQLLDWMLTPKARKSGKIEVQLKNKKTIKFKNAYCIHYHEYFSHTGGDQPMSTNISIIAESVIVEGKQFMMKKKWQE